MNTRLQTSFENRVHEHRFQSRSILKELKDASINKKVDWRNGRNTRDAFRSFTSPDSYYQVKLRNVKLEGLLCSKDNFQEGTLKTVKERQFLRKIF